MWCGGWLGLYTTPALQAQCPARDACQTRARQVSYLGLSLLGSWLILRWALKQMDPTKKNVETVRRALGWGGGDCPWHQAAVKCPTCAYDL